MLLYTIEVYCNELGTNLDMELRDQALLGRPVSHSGVITGPQFGGLQLNS
jgi:hypothetical protein